MKRAFVSSLNYRNALGVQERCLLTRKRLGDTPWGKSCRMCHKEEESTDHIVSRCSHWLSNLYVDRHDSVARNLYYLLCEAHGYPPIHYSNTIPAARARNNTKLYWNMELATTVPIMHRKPDIVLIDDGKKLITVIEVSVALATNMERQRRLKLNRYTINSNIEDDETRARYPPGPNLVGNLMSQYGYDVSFIPVVVGVCGEHLEVTARDLREKLHLSNASSLRVLERLSRSAVIGTSRIVRAHFAH